MRIFAFFQGILFANLCLLLGKYFRKFLVFSCEQKYSSSIKMHFSKWLLVFSIQLSLTNCESETEAPSAAVSWIHTSSVSFYLELISLVFGSCDLSEEKTPDLKLACEHLTNATSVLRTFLTPLADVLPTKSQVELLQRKLTQFGTRGSDDKKGPSAPKIYQKISKAFGKMNRIVPGSYSGDELLLSLFAKEEAGLDLLDHGSPLDLTAVMSLNILIQCRFIRKESSDQMRWLKTLMMVSLVPQALVLILMIYHYARTQRLARASKKRLNRAARDTELLDRLQSRIGQDLVVAN